MLKESISFQISHLKSLLESENSCVSVVKNFKGNLSLYPFHLGYLKSAVKELLDAKVSKYDPELNGIILGHSNIKVINSLRHSDSCVINLNYIADIYLFTPAVGKNLNGIVNKKSKEHIGCLIHSAFNASIPKPRTVGEDLSIWLKTHNAVQISNELEFTVSKVDLTSRVPYISGIFVRSLYSEEEVDSGVCCQDSIDEDNVKIKKKKRKSKDNVKIEDNGDSTSYHDPSQIAELFDNNVQLTKSKRKSSKLMYKEESELLSPPVKKIKKEKLSVELGDQFLLPIKIKEEPIESDDNELPVLHCDIKNEKFFDCSSPESSKKLKSKKKSLDQSFSLKKVKDDSLDVMTSSLLKEAMDYTFSSKGSGNSSLSESGKKKKKRTLQSPADDVSIKSELSVILESGSTPKNIKSVKSFFKEINSQERNSKKRKRSESPVNSEVEGSFKDIQKKKKKKSSIGKDSL